VYLGEQQCSGSQNAANVASNASAFAKQRARSSNDSIEGFIAVTIISKLQSFEPP
jgi:hypothetical protein